MNNSFKTISPINNSVYLERNYHNNIDETLEKSVNAQIEWSNIKISERVSILKNFVNDFLSREKEIVEQISWQIGRPISQAPSELKGFKERADYMLSIAEEKLSTINLPHDCATSANISGNGMYLENKSEATCRLDKE